MNKFFLSIAGSLLGAAVTASPAADAAVIVQVTNLGAADPTPGAGGENPNYTSFLVTLVTTQPGELITGVDFGGGTDVIDGFTGPMLQRRVIDPDLGTSSLTPDGTFRNGANVTSLDTHFLVPGASRVDAFAPAEDNSGVAPLGPTDTATSDFGLGTFLRGTFGLTAAARTASLDLAYLVLPNDGSVAYSAQIATTASQTAFPVQGVVAVPEPAGLAVVALTGGLLAARRRRA